ncbi:unnamed protein product [Macrosiphum euphorbiae]|uniref:Uncharacterized protein n=1 Tax=Macrosiphum euphorbiae TaxID=13131 RepID=A0AAV0W487_9HEMI|nr:unnamed protein product [Macrosiphum euphorbiae]
MARWMAKKKNGYPTILPLRYQARVATYHMDFRVVVWGDVRASATRDDVRTYAVKTVTAVEYELTVIAVPRAKVYGEVLYKISWAAAPLAPSSLIAPRADRGCVRERV